jgi:peptidoglycan-N-acetylglucosamine deacetylase
MSTTFFSENSNALAEGGLFLLTMHPHVTGYRSRIWILERLLAEITQRPDVWIATHAEIAAFVKLECPE